MAVHATDEKTRALRASGALNGNPATVTDPAFRSHPFLDPRDLVQVKYEMVRRVHVDHHAVSHTAAAFGLSRPSFYQAQSALESGGLPALVPQRRRPRRPHKLPEQLVAFAEEQLARDP